jgi:hypothetical protein
VNCNVCVTVTESSQHHGTLTSGNIKINACKVRFRLHALHMYRKSCRRSSANTASASCYCRSFYVSTFTWEPATVIRANTGCDWLVFDRCASRMQLMCTANEAPGCLPDNVCIRNICGFNGSDYKEHRLLGCSVVWILQEPYGTTSQKTTFFMKNVVFWNIKSQFVPHRRHITSPLQRPAG